MIIKVKRLKGIADHGEIYIDLTKVVSMQEGRSGCIVSFEDREMKLQSLEREKDLVKLWKLSKIHQELPIAMRGESGS